MSNSPLVDFVKARVEATDTGLKWRRNKSLSSYWNNVIAGRALSPSKDALGRPTVTMDQRKVLLASVVWALNFGEWYDYFSYADGDPANLDAGNLIPHEQDPVTWGKMLALVKAATVAKGRVSSELAQTFVAQSDILSAKVKALATHEIFDPDLDAAVKDLITFIEGN